MRNEADIIRYLLHRSRPGRGVSRGIGDDAAIIQPSGKRDWVVTTDLLIENVHFLSKAQPARVIGWKALARSLSDVAAMAARPRYALVALAVPGKLSPGWVREFFAGFRTLAQRYRVQLVGGDVSRAGQIVADVQVMGEVPRGKALLRSTARPGQDIYASGELGLAATGVLCVRRRVPRSRPGARRALQAHFLPQPRVRLASALARRGARAMIDLSDGLSTDLHHLCEASAVGARIYADRLPVPRTPESLLRRLRVSPLELALHGGEDYELLFTVPARLRLPTRLEGVRLTRVGRITKQRGVWLVRDGRKRGLAPGGWDPFRKT